MWCGLLYVHRILDCLLNCSMIKGAGSYGVPSPKFKSLEVDPCNLSR